MTRSRSGALAPRVIAVLAAVVAIISVAVGPTKLAAGRGKTQPATPYGYDPSVDSALFHMSALAANGPTSTARAAPAPTYADDRAPNNASARVAPASPAAMPESGVRSALSAGGHSVGIVLVVAAETGPGGIEPVLQGQAGEAAVRGTYDIGDKATAVIDGRVRIFDGLNGESVSEVKNVASQSYTQQLRDSVSYAQANGLRFDLYVRPDTYLTGPLRQAISDGAINLRFIP